MKIPENTRFLLAARSLSVFGVAMLNTIAVQSEQSQCEAVHAEAGKHGVLSYLNMNRALFIYS